MNLKPILLCTLSLVSLALVGCRKPDSPATAEGDKKPEDVAVQFATAESHAIDTTVTALGTLVPGQGAMAHIASPVAGRLLTVTVREGDRVTAGQVVATVDNRPQQAQLRSAASALSASEIQAQQSALAARAAGIDQSNSVSIAKLTLQSAKIESENALQQAQTALQQAQTDYQKTKAGARPQEIAQAVQNTLQTKVTRDRADTEFKRVQFLYGKGVDSRRQLEDAQTALAVANAGYETAKQQESLMKAGARAEDLQAAALRVKQAQEALAQATRSGEAKIAQAQAALQQAEQSALQVAVKEHDAKIQKQNVAQKRADLAASQATASFAQIVAPISGIVTKRTLNPGDMTDTTLSIVEIADTQALNLVANLPAEEGLKLKAGLPVRVTIEEQKEEAFEGKLLSVGQIDPQTNLLSVRISISNKGGKLRTGEYANAEIILSTSPKAITVPKQCIVTKGSKSVLFVVGADHIAHQKEVTLGAEQGELVEVIKGLALKENVIRLGQYEISEGQKVHAQEEKKEEAKGKG